MFFDNAGYSSYQFNERFRENAGYAAKRIKETLARFDAQAVVVTGKSGMALAFGAKMLVNFPLVVVRKAGDSSHGFRIEGTPDTRVDRYVILDDFVVSGDTVRRIVLELDNLAKAEGVPPADPVAVIECNGGYRGGCTSPVRVEREHCETDVQRV